MVKTIGAETARLIRENNRLKRQCEELGAAVEYVAMMADVELPEETGGEEEASDEQKV